MPDWWGELVAIPNIDDYQKLAQKIRASFEILQVRSKTQQVKNDYLSPPTPKCIGWKTFLPILDPTIPCWDYREEQLEPDQPHLLARCIHKLRWAMRPLTTFTDDAVLEGTIPRQGTPEEWARGLGMMEALQTPMPERKPTTSFERPTNPPAEEPDILTAAMGEPAASPAGEPDIPPTPQETDKKMEAALTLESPGWTEIIHPPHPVTPVG